MAYADDPDMDCWGLAAKAGDSGAMLRLASAAARTVDVDVARRWYEQAASRGSAEAKVALGKLLLGREPRSAWRWIEQAANEGDRWAVGRIAQRFLRRHPTSQNRHSRH